MYKMYVTILRSAIHKFILTFNLLKILGDETKSLPKLSTNKIYSIHITFIKLS